jgi:tetratricopeptide (TPR) repeat protein
MLPVRSMSKAWRIAVSITDLGQVALRQGDLEAAASLLEVGLASQQELGDQEGVAEAFFGLGYVAYRQGNPESARELFAESLALRRRLGDQRGSVACLERLAAVAATTGQSGRAARLFGAAEALREALGTPLPPVDHADYEHDLAATRAGLSEAALASAWEQGRALTWEEAIAEAIEIRR